MPHYRQEGPNAVVLARHPRGVTLLEVIVAMLILSVGVLAVLKSFGNISKSLQHSRFRTVAATLAQEKINVLKQQPYYRILPSTNTAVLTDVSPPVTYDTSQFAIENIVMGGVSYIRYTLVDRVMESGGLLTHVNATDPDTGLKRIAISIVWQQDGEKKSYQVTNVFNNPAAVMRRASFSGTVKTAGGVNIVGAVVKVAENTAWSSITDAAGSYNFIVSAGTYSLVAARPGYQTTSSNTWVTDNSNKVVNFVLPPQPAGIVTGAVWLSTYPVISQVMVSTNFATYEYIELFNGSTVTWNMGASASPNFTLQYRDNTTTRELTTAPGFTIVTPQILPGHFYLIANAAAPVLNGATPLMADAFYTDDILQNNQYGSVTFTAPGGAVDKVGWRTLGSPPSSFYESDYVNLGVFGFGPGNQIARHTSTDSVPMAGVGNAYDTNRNDQDWTFDTIAPGNYYPHNHASGAFPVVSGFPAMGAIITASDGFSVSTRAYAMPSAGDPDYAFFKVVNVATGTWSVIASSRGITGRIDDVTVVNGSTVIIPTAGGSPSIPAWTASYGPQGVVMSTEPTCGIISGRVLDDASAPISTPIQVKAGNATVTIEAADGTYSLCVPEDVYDVRFNPGNTNPDYVAETAWGIHSYLVSVTTGVDYNLAKTSRITAFITSDGVTALDNVALSVFDNVGLEISQAVSDATGFAYINNLPLGAQYSVQPIIGSREVSLPSSLDFTPITTGNVMVGTFTIRGSTGKILGRVTDAGSPVTLGALVVASTFTSTVPPTLSSTTASNFFIATSDERGEYSLDVLASTIPYRVRAFYTPRGSRESGTTPAVPAGGTVNGVDVSW